MEITKDKITDIFCIIDDFCEEIFSVLLMIFAKNMTKISKK